MNARRLGTSLLATAGVLAIAVSPAAAAGYTTVTEELIQSLNNELLAVAIPVTILVEAILGYTVWRFWRSDGAKPTMENRRLEITWTIATAVLLLFVGIGTYGAMASPYVTTTEQDAQSAIDDDAVVVDAVAQQWYWEFEYPDADIKSQGTLVIPAGQEIVIRTHSEDVIHSFHAPELALKADAVPGQTNYILTRVNEDQTGTYRLYCGEFCGKGHSEMLATIKVVSPDKYETWTEDPGNSSV